MACGYIGWSEYGSGTLGFAFVQYPTPVLSPDGGEGGAATHVRSAKPELSPYEKALLEGKTHLEAMYAQATPDGKPKGKEPTVSLYPKPNPLDSFSEPVRVTGFEYRRTPLG